MEGGLAKEGGFSKKFMSRQDLRSLLVCFNMSPLSLIIDVYFQNISYFYVKIYWETGTVIVCYCLPANVKRFAKRIIFQIVRLGLNIIAMFFVTNVNYIFRYLLEFL